MVSSTVQVARPRSQPAYLDAATAARMTGLAGMTNMLTIQPSAGHSAADVQRALLDVPRSPAES